MTTPPATESTWLPDDFEHPTRVEVAFGHHLRPIRADVGRLLERIDRAAPKGDSNLVLGAGAQHGGHAAGHGEIH